MSNGSSSGLRTAIWTLIVLAIVISGAVFFTVAPREVTPRVGLLTADSDPYWERVIKGAEAAAEEFDVELVVGRADGTMDSQTQLLFDFSESGLDGIAVSPVDTAKQGLALRQVAQSVDLITVDSDCEVANRACFVGADNYAAGRRAGELVKQAMPDGARIAIVMGPISKANGASRRQGIIDELLERSYGPGRPIEPLDEIVAGDTYTVATTLIDPIDPEQAQANVAAAIAEDPTINCVVGLFAYSAPAALRAIEAAGRDDITVIGFDDDPALLEAVSSGKAFAALAQDQYQYGYHAIRLLADLARGSANSIPITETVHFPPFVVMADGVEEFRAGRR